MALLRDPVTREEILAAQRQAEFAPVRSLLAPDEGYTYGNIIPLRTGNERRLMGRTRSGQPIYGRAIEPTVPLALREGAESLINLAEGTQTGMVNPEDVLNVMPMGGAASLLDEGIEGGFAAGMFIGRNNPRANPRAFEMADEMVASGRKPEDIFRQTYRETGDPVFLGRDMQLRQEVSDLGQIDAEPLADMARKVFETKEDSFQEIDLGGLMSPEYAKMFTRSDRQNPRFSLELPEVRMMSFKAGMLGDAPSASYSPQNNVIELNPIFRDPMTLEARPKTAEELRSSLLHELQHKVQGSDYLSTGSNIKLAQKEFDESLAMFDTSDAFKSVQARADEIDSARPRFSDVNRAETAKYYDDLSRRDNVGQVARKIFNSAEWYRVGDSIVRELGPVPKRSGEARNEWLRQAAARLSNVFAEQVQDKSLLDLDPKQLKSEYRKMYRKAYPSDSYETSNARRFVGDYINELRSDTSPYTLYRRKLGETEARATQARENMTLEQRANVFPERSYDVTPDAMIIDQDLFQDTPQGLLTLTRKTR